MTTIVLAAKAVIAVLLLAAGGAKLADVPGFAAAVRLFVPARAPAGVLAALPGVAGTIAAAELAAGVVSLCWPALGWVNLAVLALVCAFALVASVGFARHRGRACRCFGALTRREFGVRSLLQALVLLAAAVLAAQPVRPGMLQLGLTMHLLLLAAAALMAVAARTAARALLADTASAGMVV